MFAEYPEISSSRKGKVSNITWQMQVTWNLCDLTWKSRVGLQKKQVPPGQTELVKQQLPLIAAEFLISFDFAIRIRIYYISFLLNDMAHVYGMEYVI